MRLVLTGRSVEITYPVRQQVSRQLSRLERVLNDSAVSAQVVLYRQRHLLMTDVTLHARGDNMLSALGAGTTWPLSLKDAIAKVEQQARRVKEKWTERKRRGRAGRRTVSLPATPESSPAPPAEAPPNVPRVVRTRYAVRSMSLDEAADRFQGGGEAFVLFRDRVTGRVAMVFRRTDGQIGVLEP
jgi:putative sigma-54 modulation protein